MLVIEIILVILVVKIMLVREFIVSLSRVYLGKRVLVIFKVLYLRVLSLGYLGLLIQLGVLFLGYIRVCKLVLLIIGIN